MTPPARIGRFSGLSVPLLVAGLAALTVAGFAHWQDPRETAPAPMVAVAPVAVVPERPVPELVREARPIRHGVCLYSPGDEDEPMDDPDHALRLRDRPAEPAQ